MSYPLFTKYLLCSDLITLQWKDPDGSSRDAIVNLEAISVESAWLQTEQPIPVRTGLQLLHRRGPLAGVVQRCVPGRDKCWIEMRFADENRWERRAFKPAHLFDPITLAIHAWLRANRVTAAPKTMTCGGSGQG